MWAICFQNYQSSVVCIQSCTYLGSQSRADLNLSNVVQKCFFSLLILKVGVNILQFNGNPCFSTLYSILCSISTSLLMSCLTRSSSSRLVIHTIKTNALGTLCIFKKWSDLHHTRGGSPWCHQSLPLYKTMIGSNIILGGIQQQHHCHGYHHICIRFHCHLSLSPSFFFFFLFWSIWQEIWTWSSS